MNTPFNSKEHVMAALREIVQAKECDEQRIAHYFSKDYIQNVDGNTLDYSQFIAHMKVLKTVLNDVGLKFLGVAGEDNLVFTHHHVLANKHDGSKIHAQVLAHFTLQDGKIIRCDELTHSIQGSDEDRDLGSRL